MSTGTAAPPGDSVESAHATAADRLRPHVWIGVALTAAAALPWIVDAYTVSLASYGLVMALLALSAHVLSSVAGLPSLGQATYFGIGAYAAAICGRTLSSSGPLQLLVAMMSAALAAAVVGAAITRTRGTAFMILTLAVGEVAHIAAERAGPLTGGGNGLTTGPVVALPGTAPLILDGYTYLYVLACFLALAAALRLVLGSRTALVWRALAEHEPRTQANGYSPDGRLWQAYVVAAAVAGGGGALLVAAHRFVSPSDLSFNVGALALLAAIIGGRSMLGACGAALGIVAVRDLAGGLLTGYSPLLLGVVFIAAAMPRGRLRHIARRFPRRRR